jgi:iron complex transport system substrate-binding protein
MTRPNSIHPPQRAKRLFPSIPRWVCGFLGVWFFVLSSAGETPSASAEAVGAPGRHPSRIISLNPSLTAMLLAIGKLDHLVGVDDFSAQQIPAVSQLPRVGGLFNPSLEAVVALEPDLVVLVPSAEQRDFRNRLEELQIKVETFQNFQFSEVLENIARLGTLTGAAQAAASRVAAIERTRTAVEHVVANLEGKTKQPPTIAVVLQRDPLFVVGGENFIDSMLQMAGTRNIAAEYREPYPRVGMEWLVAASPALLLDLSPEAEANDAMAFWQRWPTIAAVANDRLISLDAALVSMPGPDLDRSLRLLASTFWGEETLGRIRREEAALAREPVR